jgi:outer membrane protein TolC
LIFFKTMTYINHTKIFNLFPVFRGLILQKIYIYQCHIFIWMMVLLVTLAGCVPLDHQPVFQPNFEKHIRNKEDRAFEIPKEFRPQTPENPDAVLPEDDGIIHLSVEQAVMFAFQNNRSLQARQLNPVIAGTFEQIERGIYDSEWFAEFEYVKDRAAEASLDDAWFSVNEQDTAAAAGVRQRLPSGTTIKTGLEYERSTSNQTSEEQKARLGFSLTQSLLRGLGPAVNMVSIRQAELDTAASIYELRGFTEALLAETEIAYWQYVLANQEIAIFEQSLEVARQQLNDIEHRIEVGLLPKIEAAAARAEAARREQALIEARSLLEENRLRLLSLIAPPGRLDLRITAASDPRIETRSISDMEDRLRLAEQSRPDLSEARLRLTQNRLETVITRNGLLPRLELFINLGLTGYSDAFSDAFREMDGNTYDFTVGVNFTHSLDNRSAKAQDRAAQASRRQAAAALANLQHIVQLDVRLAINEVERVRQQISASQVTREFEEQTLSAEKERFDVGAGTALLVAQAQRDLLASSIAEVRAVVNYRIALVKLYLAEGSLLERRGVVLTHPE